MNIFVSGGCKNGKSYYAQRLAKNMADQMGLPLYYVATMRPTDDEDRARIKRHLSERDGWGFITIEQSENICEALMSIGNKRCDSDGNASEAAGAAGTPLPGVFLLDSVTALLSNEMFPPDGDFSSPDFCEKAKATAEKVAADVKHFAELTGHTVFVSDYIYSDARHFDELTEIYRQGLALCDRTLAKTCDQVYEVAYGTVTAHKEENI